MPKIQARMIKSMLEKDGAQATLLENLTAKLSFECFKFEVEQEESGFLIRIGDCSWHNMMVKSGREKISKIVGTSIYNAEYSFWVSEFDENIEFTFEARKCGGTERCILNYKKR